MTKTRNREFTPQTKENGRRGEQLYFPPQILVCPRAVCVLPLRRICFGSCAPNKLAWRLQEGSFANPPNATLRYVQFFNVDWFATLSASTGFRLNAKPLSISIQPLSALASAPCYKHGRKIVSFRCRMFPKTSQSFLQSAISYFFQTPQSLHPPPDSLMKIPAWEAVANASQIKQTLDETWICRVCSPPFAANQGKL